MQDASPNEPPRGRLDFIRPRMTKRIRHARRGRFFNVMRRLRVWLPLLAVGILVLLFLWPTLLPNFRMEDIAKNIPDLVVDNLNYTGIDSKNQPYSIIAAQATKPSGLDGIYVLTKPEGEITLKNGVWIDAKADSGRYDKTKERLHLTGNVRIFHNQGYQLTTPEIHINLKNSDAWGDKGIVLQGLIGTIEGKGFRFSESGSVIVISGPAKANLRLQNRPVSGKSSLP